MIQGFPLPWTLDRQQKERNKKAAIIPNSETSNIPLFVFYHVAIIQSLLLIVEGML
jgi:hypothetical protein